MEKYAHTEFFISPLGEIMIHDRRGVHTYKEEDTEFTDLMFSAIEDKYPEAFESLSRLYRKSSANILFFKYRVVHRFLRCNFGEYDKRYDIDEFGDFNFEEVKCPLRYECELCDIVCRPKFNSSLSIREKEVMKMIYHGANPLKVSQALAISEQTVLTVKRNAFKKLEVHSMQEFMAKARASKMFEE